MRSTHRPTVALIGAMLLSGLMCGCQDEPVPYRQENHGSFNEEFPPHENTNGWWYVTGYLREANAPEKMYSFQFTQLDIRGMLGIPLYVLQLAMTDLQSGEHQFEYYIEPAGINAYANSDTVAFQPRSLLTRGDAGIDYVAQMNKAEIRLHFDYGKGAVWHGDNGVLVMGSPDDPVQRTVYYSYTNMPTTGQITFINDANEQTVVQVDGKSWLDRQWGPYRLTDAQSSFWEWFSLRFFDDEEIMLFAFPQHPYLDGTYVDASKNTRRVRDYTYTPTDYVEANGTCYSFGWDLTMPGIKEGHYRIVPLVDGQFHLNYFELMASVINDNGDLVGYAFVELLPGIREGMCTK